MGANNVQHFNRQGTLKQYVQKEIHHSFLSLVLLMTNVWDNWKHEILSLLRPIFPEKSKRSGVQEPVHKKQCARSVEHKKWSIKGMHVACMALHILKEYLTSNNTKCNFLGGSNRSASHLFREWQEQMLQGRDKIRIKEIGNFVLVSMLA